MRIIIAFIALLFAQTVFAAQRFEVKDGDQIQIVISEKDVSRLAVEGEGRLKKVWSPQAYLDLQADKAQGEAFFKAAEGAPKTFSFFARDDFGNTFTIIATQHNVPSQTIMLVPQNRNQASLGPNRQKELPFKKEVNSLFKSMFNETPLQGYTVQDVNVVVPVWAETEIRLVKSYRSHAFQGEVYEVKNVTQGELKFQEYEFFEFGDNVVATGLEHLSIAAKQTTKLYVVRRGGNGAQY